VPWVDSAGDLLIIASLDSTQTSWNPWSQDCFLISPNQAAWILKEFDWPYRRPENLEFSKVPLIHGAISGLGPFSDPTRQAEVPARMLRLISVFLEKGESPETRHHGYTPLHVAVLMNSLEAAEILITHGADVRAKADRPGKKTDGMNSVQFAEFLNSVNPGEFERIYDFLKSEIEGKS
jgi:ankyrin repeat protein